MDDRPPFDPQAFMQIPALPSSGDSFFASQDDWWNNACVNWSSNGWSLYASGYKRAADLLVEHVETKDAGHDTLVYPALFLYRQYLELEIKDTLRMARRLRDIDGSLPLHHRIADLWNELHTHLLAISPGDSEAELAEIARLIKELAAVDPASMAFRYPADKHGTPSLQGMSHINLRNVKEVIAKISVLLEGANSQVGEYLQAKLEYESEMRDYYS